MLPSGAQRTVTRPCKSREGGFTLVELVSTFVILAILAFVAVPRFSDRGSINASIFANQAQALLRLAQKQAIAQNRQIYVHLDGVNRIVCFAAADLGGSCSGSQNKNRVLAPTGVSYTPTPATQDFYFDGTGKPFGFAQRLDIKISGESGPEQHMYIELETGYVHP